MSEELNLDGMSSSGNRREINRFKVTEGSHIFRILPPFGTDHRNVPSRQVQLHWGFYKKDGKTSPIPCSYPSEGYCPICEKVKEQEALAERLKAQGDEDGSKEILKAAGEIKVRRSYLLNAANKAGEVGILEITKTSIDQLVELFKQYQNKYGKNPVSLAQGVWFVFSRTGKGFNTKYTVEFNKTILTLDDGDQVEKLDNTALSPNIAENFEKLAYDIHKMYTPVAASDLKKILDGAPIDDVIVRKTKEEYQAEKAASQAAAQSAPTPASAPKAAPAPVAAPAAAKPAAPKAAAKPAAKPAPTPVVDESEVDDIMSILNDE
jgi:hypothetical protein